MAARCYVNEKGNKPICLARIEYKVAQDSNKITTRQIQDKNYEPHGKYEAYRRAEENLERHMEEKIPSAEPKKINMAFTDKVYDTTKKNPEIWELQRRITSMRQSY